MKSKFINKRISEQNPNHASIKKFDHGEMLRNAATVDKRLENGRS